MTVAEAWTPFHAWLHGGAIPENDECTLVLLSHGKIDTACGDVPIAVQPNSFEAAPSAEISFCCPVVGNLSLDRGPPTSLLHS